MGLSETAVLVRRLIIQVILGIIALIVLWIIFSVARNLWRQLNPPPEEPPTAGFGKLPALRLPALPLKGVPTYVLDTASGELPSFSDRAHVVAMQPVTPSPLGEQRAKELAKKFDFGGEGELSSDKRSIIFRDAIDERTLTVNLTSQNFTLTTDLDHIEKTVPKGSAPTGSEAVKETLLFLDRKGIDKGGYNEGKQTTQPHQVVDGEVKDALSASEAHFIRVDFFRNLTDISSETFPILPMKPKIGLVQIWITDAFSDTFSASEAEINNFLAISYTVWEIDKSKQETYPLKPVADAWEDIKQGKGIAEVLVEGSSPLEAYKPLSLKTVSIRKVELAYFDDSSSQEYLQPIYVFTGGAKTADGKEADYTAYAQAVSEEWVK